MQDMSYEEWGNQFISESEYEALLSAGQPEPAIIDSLKAYESFEVVVDTYEKPRPRIVIRSNERTEPD